MRFAKYCQANYAPRLGVHPHTIENYGSWHENETEDVWSASYNHLERLAGTADIEYRPAVSDKAASLLASHWDFLIGSRVPTAFGRILEGHGSSWRALVS